MPSTAGGTTGPGVLPSLSCLVLLAARRWQVMWDAGVLPDHFERLLVPTLQQIDAGDWFVRGPQLATTGIYPGGGLFYWLHLPARLVADPLMGLALLYLTLEALALLAFLRWAPRAGLSAAQTWIAGLFLALCRETKLELVENSTLAGIFAVALFAAASRASGDRRVRAWIMPGVLAGLTAQLHLVGLFLYPSLLVQWWVGAGSARGARARALVGACLGLVLALCLGLPGAEVTEPEHLGASTAPFLHGLTLDNTLAWLAVGLRHPLPLVGAVVVVVLWLASSIRASCAPRPLAQRTALVWALSYTLLLSLAQCREVPPDAAGVRYGLAAPGWAVLGSTAVTLVLGQMARLVPLRWRVGVVGVRWPRVLFRYGAIIAVIVIAMQLVVQTNRSLTATLARHRADWVGPHSCAREVLERASKLPHFRLQLERLFSRKWPPSTTADLRLVGPAAGRMQAALYWHRTAGWRGAVPWPPRRDKPGWMIAWPHLPTFDLRQQPGAVDLGVFFVAPAVQYLGRIRDTQPEEFTIDLPQEMVAGGWLAVFVKVTPGAVPPDAPATIPRLKLNGRPLSVTHRCAAPEWRSHDAVLLARLPPDAAGGTLSLLPAPPTLGGHHVDAWFLVMNPPDRPSFP